MSRVIRAAVWEKNPHLIDVPPPPPPPPPPEEEEIEKEPELSEEDIQSMLARITERDQEVEERLQQA